MEAMQTAFNLPLASVCSRDSAVVSWLMPLTPLSFEAALAVPTRRSSPLAKRGSSHASLALTLVSTNEKTVRYGGAVGFFAESNLGDNGILL